MSKPSTKRYDALEREPHWQKFWEENGTNHFDPNSPKPVFSIDTPPPTVSGAIHLGHIYSYSQAEIVARYKRLAGFNVRYPMGYDNNGLPTERLVEKENNVRGKDMALLDFVKLCLETTEKYKLEYQKIWKKIGLSVDWRLDYSTISADVQKLSQTVFKNLFDQKIIYQQEMPVLFCTECGTSIAQADVEDKEFESVFYDIVFKDEDGNDVIIATTRPELLPACVAAFVHPADNRHKKLIGKSLTTPLGAKIPVLADDKVAIDKGTGVVMCCTYGDETDIYWVKKHNLPEIKLVQADGKIAKNDLMPSIAGQTVKEARKTIVEYLKQNKSITDEKPISHAVGVHERCGTPIEFIPRNQWFIKILDIKNDLLAYGDKIKWYPAFMKKRYQEWIDGLKWDWCITRERYYGIPVPVFTCEACHEKFVPSEDRLPIDPRTAKDIECPHCKSGDVTPDTNVLDTWFTSALTPDINNAHPLNGVHQGKMYPMSMRPQAHDIIRTWVVYTVTMGHYRHHDIPWHELMISGHILLRGGKKISKKTGGGGYDPLTMIAEHSADALRYAMCGSALGRDGYYEEAEVEKGKKLITKLYNATKLTLMLLEDYNPTQNPSSFQEVSDQWIISKSHSVSHEMAKYMNKYEVGLARKVFEDYFWADYCDNYLEIAKSRIYNEGSSKEAKLSAQKTLYQIALNNLIMITPFMPHIAEELYHVKLDESNTFVSDTEGYLYQGQKSINELSWPEKSNLEIDQEAANAMLKIIYEIRKYKTSHQINLGAEIGKVYIKATQEQKTKLEPYLQDIKNTTKSADLVFEKDHDIAVEITL